MTQFTEDDYSLPFFSENDYVRRKCRLCGSYFWTQNADLDICGESPCVPYEFIGDPPTKRSYTVSQMRRKFLSFFESRGHEVVRPYPVVARWRDDLLFTIASIVDFQPYVTEGLIPPPANPLVVSQPCLRFEDIDLVGYTMGRHWTIFEMGGHHAFNYEGKPQIYWKDETVRFHHELLTKELGVPSWKVNYKEGVWSGGGNAGPDVEGLVSGLEVSTLVFMQYRVVNGSLVPMPIKVVDTGYGMERWTWLSQGTPSAFEAVFGRLVDRVQGWIGVGNEGRKLLEENAKHSMQYSKMKRQLARQYVSERLGVDPRELERAVSPFENIFSLLDHTKALVFILSEGVVPSNAEEGYLARLLFRRSYRLLRKMNTESHLAELLELQIRYWSKEFPHLKEMQEEIIEAVLVEESKYLETLDRGQRLVSRTLGEFKKAAERELATDRLVELYDSHGLTPDDVKEIAEAHDVEIEVPEEFYSLVAERHSKTTTDSKDQATEQLRQKATALPKTGRIFYEDAYRKSFQAKVLAVIDERYVVLDRTCFYAEGGGQLSDTGKLSASGDDFRVAHVWNLDDVLLHELEKNSKTPAVGSTVDGAIDWTRREALMRHHTATHILVGASRKLLGDHAWQSGAQKGIENSRLDISHWNRLTGEQIEELEILANKVVMEGRSVETKWVPRNQAEKQYGFRLYQGGAAPGKEIRVVRIEDWDVEACGGTHCRSTCEVGFINILRTERVQDGVERIVFAAGPAALADLQKKERMIDDVATLLSSPVDAVIRNLGKLVEERDQLRRALNTLEKEFSKTKAEELLRSSEAVGGIRLVSFSGPYSSDYFIELGNTISQRDPDSVSVFIDTSQARIVVMVGSGALGLGLHAGRLADETAKALGGRGGGEARFGQGGGRSTDNIQQAEQRVRKYVSSLLEKSEQR